MVFLVFQMSLSGRKFGVGAFGGGTHSRDQNPGSAPGRCFGGGGGFCLVLQ